MSDDASGEQHGLAAWCPDCTFEQRREFRAPGSGTAAAASGGL